MSENNKSRSAIELRELRYFVTLAQELNFRKAAGRLFITQPALSHQIAMLETTLGVRLFERNRREVWLTEAGKAVLDDARHLLIEADAILSKASRMGAMESLELRVGFPEYANRTVIPEMVSAFRSRYPRAGVTLREGYSRTLLPELRDGRLDVGFMMIPPAEELGDLEVEVVIDQKPGLLMSDKHPLAARTEVPLSALADTQLLLADRSVNPVMYDMVAGWLQQAGVQPRFFKIGGSGVYTFDTVLQVIQSGEAVSLGTESMSRDLPAGVVFRPINGSVPHFQMGLVWSPSNDAPLLNDFLAVVRELRPTEESLSAIS